MQRLHLLLTSVLLLAPAVGHAQEDKTRILPPGKKPADVRLSKVRTLDDTDFFLTPPATRAAWEARRQAVREQVLVATGLWPMPERQPLKPTVHGKKEMDGYTIEKVFFASLPGHYVTGNLYRPAGKSLEKGVDKASGGKRAGVLFAHGHWANGRLHDAGEKEAKAQVAAKGEKTLAGGHYPLQAPCAQLARMGCVVFTYDMVGYADSKALGHTAFADADAELRTQSLMGLQTWNTLRAFDFLSGLPDVDAKRIGVTGASGGGTQTFILGAIDDRPAVAFPAVMVSTRMQGGCVCENCSLLRVGTGNVEMAAVFAPKPLGMTGANDWTLEIEKKGYPELKKIYQLYDAEDKVIARTFPQFGHNYNQVSREVMYGWFNKHLGLNLPTPIAEQPFEPVPPKELSVFDEAHPQPKDAVDAARLRQYWTATADKQMDALLPVDKKKLDEFRKVVGTALRVLVNDRLPSPDEVEAKREGGSRRDGLSWQPLLLGRKGQGEQVPALLVRGPEFDGTVVVWVDPAGKASLLKDGKLTPAAQKVLDGKAAILAIDAFGTGELALDKPAKPNPRFAGYTFGYNRSLLAQRVHDVLTAVAFAKGQEGTKKVHLLGSGKAGPWVLLARGLCGEGVERTAADVDGFRFEKVRTTDDEMLLPGALKYGGLPGLTAVSAPSPLLLWNQRGTGMGKWLKPAYKSAGAEANLTTEAETLKPDEVAAWVVAGTKPKAKAE